MKDHHPPRLIDGWLGPGARCLERHHVSVAASVDRTYEALQQARLAHTPLVRFLFTLRRIPFTKDTTLRRFFSKPPFLILEENAPREIVFGVAGRFAILEPPGRPEALWSPADFRAYAGDGGMKALLTFRVEDGTSPPAGTAPHTGGQSRLSTETWVETFGPGARRLFRAYWLLVGPFSALTRREFLRVARKGAEQGAEA